MQTGRRGSRQGDRKIESGKGIALLSNPYIKIISDALKNIVSFELFEDSLLDEEITIQIVSIIESALKVIKNDWVDPRDFSNFNMLLDLYKEDNPYVDKMVRRINCYHQASLQACEREGWKKFDDFYVEKEQQRFTTTLKKPPYEPV
jgi:hypothetical protein